MDIVIYNPLTSRTASSRFTYVCDWLFGERLQLSYTITDDEQVAAEARFCIAYGKPVPNSISIPAVAAEEAPWIESELKECEPAMGKWNELPVLFAVDEGGYTLPFDMLSAIFYLLSRYEEYFAFAPDKHGRYPAIESILFKESLLSRPIADEWVETLRQLMETAWQVSVPRPAFAFLPTYDIDMAYAHAFKGIGRILGAYMKAFLRGDVQQINERSQVLKKKKKDPYDSFAWLHLLHRQYNIHPLYFILCALRRTPFDKNIHPMHPPMMRVIKQLAKDGDTGIHPSYFSMKGDTAEKEKKVLEQIIGHAVVVSRQHYIKLDVPDTFRLLIKNGIAEDYSMGYGSHFGFRAGTGSSFLWYDLQNETVTNLRTHPFCFMDTTGHFELGLSVEQSFAALLQMTETLRSTGSTLITVFHNFSLGTATEWQGWNEAYERFIKAMSSKYSSK